MWRRGTGSGTEELCQQGAGGSGGLCQAFGQLSIPREQGIDLAIHAPPCLSTLSICAWAS